MSDYQTGNAVPSNDPRDLDDNATIFDRLLMDAVPSVPDRLGALRKTWWQMEQDASALVSPNVAALAALSPLADKAFYFSSAAPVAMGSYTLTSFVRNLGVSANDAAFRTAINAAKSGANTDITSITGTAASLTNARTIAATGDATWSVSFNGAGNVTAALTLANSGVSAGTYSQVTVNAKGLVTAANNGNAFANVTLSNGWVVTATGRAVYRKVGDNLQLDLKIQSGTATDGTSVGTLPAGFRPLVDTPIVVASSAAVAVTAGVGLPRVVVKADGTILCFNCTNTGIFINALIPLI